MACRIPFVYGAPMEPGDLRAACRAMGIHLSTYDPGNGN
jgi:hypothetical protein